MNLGNLIVNLAVNLSALQAGLNQASQNLNQWANKAGEDMKKVGEAMSLYVTAPLSLMGAASAKAAIDFESAFAGVRKTVDATEAQYAELERGIRSMAKTIPATANEIAAVAEAAGQLGIQRENIMGFARVMIDLGESTNLASEEAATSLARLANITQMPQSQFDRLGSTVVALGNTLATTEAEIVEMGLRLAGAGKQVGMTEAQILGFAGALSSVGIAAEAGGTAFSRVFKDIYSAVATGNKSLATFAQVAGMTTAQFKQQFEQDAAGAIIGFIEGLGKIGAAGGNTIAILEKLNLSDIRVSDSLLRASGAGDLFRQSIEKGTSAWQENTALTKEAEERYKTLASQLAITRNHLTEIAITFGRDLMPMIQSAAKYVRDLSESFSALDPGVRQAIVVVAGLVAAIGPLLALLGSLIVAVAPGGVLAVGFAALANPIGLTVAALVALGIAITAAVSAFKKSKEASRETVASLREQVASAGDLAARYEELETKTNRTAAEEAERAQILAKLEALSPGLISGYDAQGRAIGANKTALEKYNAELREKLRLEEESAKKAVVSARERAAAARIDGVNALAQLNAMQAKRDAAVKKAEERLARAEANLAKTATVGNRNAVEDAKKYLTGTIEAWDKQIVAKQAEMKAIRQNIEESAKAYEALRNGPEDGKGGATPAPAGDTNGGSTLTDPEEFTKLQGIQLAQARHSAKMITDAQYLNALRAEAARLERLGVTTSQEYLSVRAAIASMAPDALSEANKALNLELERVKLFKTGKAGEIKALEAHLAKLKTIQGTELEQLQTQNRIAALQETKVDLAAKLRREHEEDLLISAKAGEGLDDQVKLQEAYVERVRQAAEEKKDDVKLQDELLRAEKDLLSVKERQAGEQKRIADEAKRAADEAARANKEAFDALKGLSKGFAGVLDTSKIDDLMAKLAAQKDFTAKLEAMGADESEIERSRKDEQGYQVEIDRAKSDQSGALPGFLADNIDTLSQLPTLLAGAATHLAGLGAALVPLLPIIAAVAGAMAVLHQVWTQNAGGIQEAVGNLLTSLGDFWDGLMSQIQPFVGVIGEVLSYTVNQLAGVFSVLAAVAQAVGWALGLLKPIIDPIAAAFRAVNNAIIDFINWIRGFFGGDPLKKVGEGAQERKQDAAAQLTLPQMQIPKMAAQIGGAVGKAVSDVMGSFTSINPLPVEDMAKANVFGIGPSSRFYYEKEARVSIDLNVTGEADPASIARAFEDSGLRAMLADTVGGEVSVRSLNPRFA